MNGQADIVIGKSSVVAFDARSIQRSLIAVAKLTDKQGWTTQSGLIVVAKDDPATTASELQDYRFFLGPPDSDEKHKAVLRLLEKNGISALENEQSAICNACSEGATKVLELQRQSVRAATAVSSYAAPLLEGCGTFPPDSLRVIAKTKAVPFIEAFASDQLSEAEQDRITDALLAAADDPELCTALEFLAGFVPMNESTEFGTMQPELKADQPAIETDNRQVSNHRNDDEGVKEWTQWRGMYRDARVACLPDNPGAEVKVVWRNPLTHQGLGGIAATEDLVVFGDRDIDDTHDVWRCLDSFTGAELWQVKILAGANLDYGNSPRTTPLIHEDKVYLLGALGDLLCVDFVSGEIHWQCNLRDRFGATSELTWGYCGSPLLVDNLLIVAPGAKDASIVALDESSGDVVWKTPGSGPSYGSLIVGTFGGKKQIVGHDAISLGGWDVSSGKRLWSVVPDVPGDFNVPTPLSFDGK